MPQIHPRFILEIGGGGGEIMEFRVEECLQIPDYSDF